MLQKDKYKATAKAKKTGKGKMSKWFLKNSVKLHQSEKTNTYLVLFQCFNTHTLSSSQNFKNHADVKKTVMPLHQFPQEVF